MFTVQECCNLAITLYCLPQQSRKGREEARKRLAELLSNAGAEDQKYVESVHLDMGGGSLDGMRHGDSASERQDDDGGENDDSLAAVYALKRSKKTRDILAKFRFLSYSKDPQLLIGELDNRRTRRILTESVRTDLRRKLLGDESTDEFYEVLETGFKGPPLW